MSNEKMKFEWGEVSGEDKNKLEISIDPKEGFICARNIEIIQIRCEPQESVGSSNYTPTFL